MNPSFTPFGYSTGVLYDYSKNKFPSILHSWHNQEFLYMDREDSTYYGFVQEGLATLQTEDGRYFPLTSGMYFCCNVPARLVGGRGIVMERLKFTGQFSIGGPIEKNGRLAYIDGCTDTLLISPPRMGDPCLNALYFPKGINQTPHTHPSMRVGLVMSGKGECITPWGNVPLFPGQIFIIHEEGEVTKIEENGQFVGQMKAGTHCFRTEDSEMVVIAYHPDSDFGPTDEDHPMLNRTIVDGVSAKHIDSIRTKSAQ